MDNVNDALIQIWIITRTFYIRCDFPCAKLIKLLDYSKELCVFRHNKKNPPPLNSGVWNQIEMSCRRWAEKYGDIYIVCGPILFRQEHETIGPNKVVVPEAFFKVVLCLNDTPKGIGFICRNTDGSRAKDFYVNSISQVERITGMTFFPNIPKNIEEKVKGQADLKQWEGTKNFR